MNFIKPNWPAPKQIKAYTTLRTSWGDHALDPQSSASEQALTSLLNLPARPFWIKQTHGTDVVETNQQNIGVEADASYTSQSNHICAVLTADCLPILICNQSGTQVAAIHAGWRGLANGIIEESLKRLNSSGEDLLVWLGPAIGPNKFEVGRDVFDAFTQQHVASASAFTPNANEKWLADLYELAKLRLQLHGIHQIYGGEYCTHTQSDLFFSYRRDGKTGRMASLIWIE